MKSVIFDIDGTLADLRHREHHVRNGGRNWDAFFAGAEQDSIYPEIRDLALTLSAEHPIILVSGRPEKTRGVTQAWLRQYGVPYQELHMRPDGDCRQDFIVKGEILDRLLAEGKEIAFVVDDRTSVVAMWRERGLTCLQCRDWHEDERPQHHGPLTVMVGPSGAGKTWWLGSTAAADAGIHPSHILSSDRIRLDLLGDWRDQSQNERVFSTLHAVTKERLCRGLPTVIDATNIRRKDRRACAELADGGAVRYFVIDRPMPCKLLDAGWRSPEVIARHDNTFRSQVKDILAGDDLPNVTVTDLRSL